jgi:hypothetical protein
MYGTQGLGLAVAMGVVAGHVVPPLRSHPKLVLGAVGLAALGGGYMWR